jgi:uncharacterized protein (TIGR02118 family)
VKGGFVEAGPSTMTRITILYPSAPGTRFDMTYYLDHHMPRSIALLSTHPGFRGVWVDRGVGGGAPGAPAPHIALCQYLFDSAESFMEAFTPHAAELQGDISNYTDVTPVIQISEVIVARTAATRSAG